MEGLTREERRARIGQRIATAAARIAARTDFDFGKVTDETRKVEEALNESIMRYVDGDANAEEVQQAWVAYAKAHQLKQPEPQTLFGTEEQNERTSELQPVGKRRGRRTGKREQATREWRGGGTGGNRTPETD